MNKKIFLLLIVMFLFVNTVYAGNPNQHGEQGDSSDSSGDDPGTPTPTFPEGHSSTPGSPGYYSSSLCDDDHHNCDHGELYHCGPEHKVGKKVSSSFDINVYDLRGNLIEDNDTTKLIAGTAYMINVKSIITVEGGYSYYEPCLCPDSTASIVFAREQCNLGEGHSFKVEDAMMIGNNTHPYVVTYYNDDLSEFVVSSGRVTQLIGDTSARFEASYNIPKTCLNRYTGKVKYLGDGLSCGSDEWIDVNQYYGVYDKSIYFIPMNLKSNKLFGIEVDTVADSDIMQYWTFGDDGKIHWVSQIKTIQKFFAESSSGGSTKFSGFAFFSRQIDPYNFSLKNTSSCNMWRNKTDDDYIAQAKDKLSESFDKVTYSTVVLNNDIISDIRSYNKEKPYTSWDNIRLDGSSQYIDNNDIIIRQSGTSYYKLGCGPLNKGRGVCD